eukprot:CAMPEP_0185850908 /NCGR_PEP_ID=MMETSP1354-20130828/4855_1 /TAXON_ID=708628 /ORGANISM="Erythrolobus madagascarensis, Strain CCMP3276" /LENGTH=63 /DNA_ID=CAMNT_0028551635 /DNA_START=209 /DNA_END=400 /DNA_ORIENTATION=-
MAFARAHRKNSPGRGRGGPRVNRQAAAKVNKETDADYLNNLFDTLGFNMDGESAPKESKAVEA